MEKGEKGKNGKVEKMEKGEKGEKVEKREKMENVEKKGKGKKQKGKKGKKGTKGQRDKRDKGKKGKREKGKRNKGRKESRCAVAQSTCGPCKGYGAVECTQQSRVVSFGKQHSPFTPLIPSRLESCDCDATDASLARTRLVRNKRASRTTLRPRLKLTSGQNNVQKLDVMKET